MSIHAPPPDWFKAPSAGERTWIGIALTWCLVMSAMMPFWHFKGKQNSTGESYAVTPADFDARVTAFVEAHGVGEAENGFPVVEPPPGGEAYLKGQMWSWYPVLKLRRGQTYRLHVSSMDLQHGLSIQPVNMNFQVLPGYDHVLTVTPTEAKDYSIICNEFCGIGHHLMVGRISVVE